MPSSTSPNTSASVHQKELVYLFLDDHSARHHETIDLTKKGEELKVIAIYCCKNHNTLDLSFTVNHLAENTTSELYVYGLLKDHAKKTCRLTINFHKGSSGSTGTEREEVFLLSDHAKNLSEPIINCSEENVKGSHGASVGHLDPAQLTYLESRGFPEAEARIFLAKTILKKALVKISDKSQKSSVQRALDDIQYNI